MIYFYFPGTKEQRDKLEILPKAGTGQDGPGQQVEIWDGKRDGSGRYTLPQKVT